ncbi:MAG: alanyl-tRNA editing protein [Gemmiger sp.]
MRPTEKIYETRPFDAGFDSTVLCCEKEKEGWAVALEATAFFPEGGGQPCDTGTLGGARVREVHSRQGGVIWHTVDAPLEPGSRVHGEVDWPARLDHMQQHTGEHILSGVLHRLYGAENVGFHIGDPAVRMDVDLPLTARQLARAEELANEAVRADLPVRCWYPQPEELAALPYRSKKELDGPVRLVEVPGADLCACCGTHLARTGQVGMIKILSVQPYKGGVRLAVVCGERACREIACVWADAEEAGRALSAAPGRLAPAVERQHAAQAADRQRIAALQNTVAGLLAASAAVGEPAAYYVEGADGDGLRRICLAAAQAACAPCAVFAPGGQGLAYAAASPQDGPDVRPLVKALNERFSGRGGGKAGFCQGSLALAPERREEAMAFFRSRL